MPRRSKRTDTRTDALLAALREGATRSAAAHAAAIDRATLYRWLEDPALAAAVEEAEAEAEARMVRVVTGAAVTDWRAAAWWLERRRSEDYGRRTMTDLRLDVRRAAERVAAESGGVYSAEELLAEAEAIVRESGGRL